MQTKGSWKDTWFTNTLVEAFLKEVWLTNRLCKGFWNDMWFITRLQMPVALMPIVGNIAMSNFLKAVWEEHIVHQGLLSPLEGKAFLEGNVDGNIVHESFFENVPNSKEGLLWH